MDYPYIFDDEKLNKRQLRNRRKSQAAWLLVHHAFEEVTTDEYYRAYELLNRCIRYAIANDRFNESETELNCNNPARRHQADLLWNRLKRLDNELERYNARLTGDMYPQVVDMNRNCNKVICLLHSEYGEQC